MSVVAHSATLIPPSSLATVRRRRPIALIHPRPCRVRHCAQVKHEVRPFDGERPCHRSVIVQFIRKPVKDGSDKILLDL